MSTDRKRLSSAIQRIAEQSPGIRQAIEATRARGDQPSAAGVGTSDAERDRICCDGSTAGGDNPNPGTDTRDPDSGGQDGSSGLNGDNPADIGDMGPGSLTGVHDCATGEPVRFDGADWVPPEGWESPVEPPVLSDYDPSKVFNISANTCYPGLCWEYAIVQTCSQAKSWIQTRIGVTDNDMDALVPNCTDTHSGAAYGFTPRNCPSTNSGIQSVCALPPPREDSWPSDSYVNLAIKNSSIVGSKYDPENDGSYSKPMSEIELCDDFGNSFYLSPSAGGGWKSISDLTTGPDGHLYDSTGMQIRRISHDEFTDSTV
ncbi:MAG: hypothetical protein ACQEXC_14010 [Pseudomonadota bacterium]